jgi:hypothetical protein
MTESEFLDLVKRASAMKPTDPGAVEAIDGAIEALRQLRPMAVAASRHLTAQEAWDLFGKGGLHLTSPDSMLPVISGVLERAANVVKVALIEAGYNDPAALKIIDDAMGQRS